MGRLPTNEVDNGWDTPNLDDAVRRVNAVLDGGEDEDPKPEKGPGAGGGDADPDDAPEGGEGGGADRPAGKADPETDEEPVYVIDGERYTLDEIRAMKAGSMMQADYTRKTQALAAERKALEEERRGHSTALSEALAQNRQIMAHLLRQSGVEIDPETGKPVQTETGEPADPRILAAIKEQGDRIEAIQREQQTREQAAEQQRVTDLIADTFERTMGALYEKHGVADEHQRYLLRMAVLGANPDGQDPATGQVTADSVERAIRTAFQKIHGKAAQATRGAVDKTLKGMKPAKRPVVTPTPTREQPKPGSVGILKAMRSKEGRMPDWDSDGNQRAFLDRANAVLSGDA